MNSLHLFLLMLREAWQNMFRRKQKIQELAKLADANSPWYTMSSLPFLYPPARQNDTSGTAEPSVFVPGASIKGKMRAWAERQVKLQAWAEREGSSNLIGSTLIIDLENILSTKRVIQLAP